MQIKQKYIDRIVMQVEIEIDNIFNIGDDPDMNYLTEKIIENHVVDMLDRIKELYKEKLKEGER